MTKATVGIKNHFVRLQDSWMKAKRQVDWTTGA